VAHLGLRLSALKPAVIRDYYGVAAAIFSERRAGIYRPQMLLLGLETPEDDNYLNKS
jgi:hypothetical protein